nr:MAG TPA: hypothetical protein [Caudoviricetes sp.]DAX47371.1 MAG TPA: hypothetical protein [Caudoviricetes sp.]DAX78473.1 MAG TPA: hypothetical protein [Caudoviricetes sp.]
MIQVRVLSVKEDRLDELTKFGFVKDEDQYTYSGERMGNFQYKVTCFSWYPVLSVSEYDVEWDYDGTSIDIPDVIMELIEAGMVESYEDR